MSSLPLKDSIIDSYSQFFRKILQHHPLKEDLFQNLANFQQVILSDNSNYLQTKTFISSLYTKPQAKPSQPSNRPSNLSSALSPTLPTDSSLKTFTHEKMRYPFSVLTKFTYTPFKDYLIKNSISLPIDSTLSHKYSHIRELLPDSQNFYRALGLGLLEVFLADQGSLHKVAEWYNKVFNKEIVLSTQIYPFGPEELRSTFCGYLKQIIQAREDTEETREAKKARNLLYQMDSKDTVFDIALVSFIKEVIISKSEQAKSVLNDLESRLKSHDSMVIGDLLSEIPQIFGINVIVQAIQNKEVSEFTYTAQGIDTKAYPTLHILNEKQLSYQNFCVLNLDNLESDLLVEKSVSAAHSRNTSLTRLQTGNCNTRSDKSFNSELKAASERIEKNLRPPHPTHRRGNAGGGLDDLSFQMKSLSDKPARSNSLRFGNEESYSKLDDYGVYDKSIINEESPSKDLMTLSKILSGYLDPKQKNLYNEKSPINQNTSQQYIGFQDAQGGEQGLKKVLTPSKQKSESPVESDLSPLLNLNILPLNHNKSSPNEDYTGKLEVPTKLEMKSVQISQGSRSGNILNQKDVNEETGEATARPGDSQPTLKPMAEEQKADDGLTKPKIITMVPKYMSNLPSNPFSSNPFSMGSNMSGLPPMNQQIPELSSRGNSRTGSKPNSGSNSFQAKRFSLNPLGFLGPNGTGDVVDRKNSRGRDLGDENYETNINQKGVYKPSANMSVGAYGNEYNERRMY